jgi:hypothetical protein
VTLNAQRRTENRVCRCFVFFRQELTFYFGSHSLPIEPTRLYFQNSDSPFILKLKFFDERWFVPSVVWHDTKNPIKLMINCCKLVWCKSASINISWTVTWNIKQMVQVKQRTQFKDELCLLIMNIIDLMIMEITLHIKSVILWQPTSIIIKWGG